MLALNLILVHDKHLHVVFLFDDKQIHTDDLVAPAVDGSLFRSSSFFNPELGQTLIDGFGHAPFLSNLSHE